MASKEIELEKRTRRIRLLHADIAAYIQMLLEAGFTSEEITDALGKTVYLLIQKGILQ